MQALRLLYPENGYQYFDKAKFQFECCKEPCLQIAASCDHEDDLEISFEVENKVNHISY